jgi:hypothetical protein
MLPERVQLARGYLVALDRTLPSISTSATTSSRLLKKALAADRRP